MKQLNYSYFAGENVKSHSHTGKSVNTTKMFIVRLMVKQSLVHSVGYLTIVKINKLLIHKIT